MVVVHVGQGDRVQVQDVLAREGGGKRPLHPRVDEHGRGTVLDEDGITLAHVQHHHARGDQVAPARHDEGGTEENGGRGAQEVFSPEVGPGHEEGNHQPQGDDGGGQLVGRERDRRQGDAGELAEDCKGEVREQIARHKQSGCQRRRPRQGRRQGPQRDEPGKGNAQKDVGKRGHERQLREEGQYEGKRDRLADQGRRKR